MAELVERSVLVDRDTWSKVMYQATTKGRRGTRTTAGEILRKGAAEIHSKMGLW